MKKGQAALEYIFTHGWAIVAVITVISTIYYFSAYNPYKFLPEVCTLVPNLGCSDFVIATSAAVLKIDNGLGYNITVENLNLTSESGSTCSNAVINQPLQDGETKFFDISGCNNGPAGSVYKGIINLRYNLNGNSHLITGRIITKIEPGVSYSTTTTSTTITTTSTTTTTIAGTTTTTSTTTTTIAGTTTTSTTTTIPGSTTTSTTSTTTTSTTTSTTTTTIVTTVTLIPTDAVDNYGNDQISPDSGSTDGTVDLSNDDTRWLTVNNDYIEVRAWDQIIPSSTVTAVTTYCEVDFVNNKPSNVVFQFNTGSGWSSNLCSQSRQQQTIFSCDLYTQGVDTYQEVNNLDVRCKMTSSSGGSIGFSVDSIRTSVTYQQ